jgi:hypothetical protein
VAISFDALRSINLFDVFQVINSMVLVPALIPIALGMVYKRTPGWTGWSTVVVGMATGALAKLIYSPQLIERTIGLTQPLNAREVIDVQFVFIFAIVSSVAIAWFFLTTLWHRKTPSAPVGWGALLAGLGAGATALGMIWAIGTDSGVAGSAKPLTAYLAEHQMAVIFCASVVVAAAWFFASAHWHTEHSSEADERVEALFRDMRTPVNHVTEDVSNQDAIQCKLVGIMCFVFGGFITLCAAIPNPPRGRIAFAFIGGVILLLGGILWRAYRRTSAEQLAAAPTEAAPEPEA